MISLYKDREVLITGGAGFIGSHLAENLIGLGARVTIFDNFSTGTLANLASIAQELNFVGGDVRDYATCLWATQNKSLIFHCAAQTSVPGSMEAPLDFNQTNIQGTANILEAARCNGVQRVVFSSSSAVYGQREGQCHENDPCNPTSVYGFSKLYGEMLCKNYFQFFKLETVCLRYFNVYGPRQNPQGPYASAYAKFTQCMQENRPFMIFGDGSQTRDFVSVQEVVKANLQVGMAQADQASGEVFNVASGKSITLLQLVQDLQKQFPHFNQKIAFGPARYGDIQHIQASCEKYLSLLS